MASKYTTDLSLIDIRQRAWYASQNSDETYKWLQQQNRRLAKIANTRLKLLEQNGYDMFAYDRAITYLHNQGRNRFAYKLAAQSDYEGMVQQLTELSHFINSKTSTVAGAKSTLKKKIAKLAEYTGREYTDEEALALARLLSTDSTSMLLREVRGDSQEVIDIIEEAAITGSNVEELNRVIDRHLAGYTPFGDNSDYLNYDELMDELRSMIRGDSNGGT